MTAGFASSIGCGVYCALLRPKANGVKGRVIATIEMSYKQSSAAIPGRQAQKEERRCASRSLAFLPPAFLRRWQVSMDAERSNRNAGCDLSNLPLREQLRHAGPAVVIGCGKTNLRCRLQLPLEDRKRVAVSGSQAIDKHSIKLATFIAALFYDLSTDVQVRPHMG